MENTINKITNQFRFKLFCIMYWHYNPDPSHDTMYIVHWSGFADPQDLHGLDQSVQDKVSPFLLTLKLLDTSTREMEQTCMKYLMQQIRRPSLAKRASIMYYSARQYWYIHWFIELSSAYQEKIIGIYY